MRYYTDTDTLFIRGDFRAASTGTAGGIRPVSTLFSHTVSLTTDPVDTQKQLELVAAAAGIDRDVFGLLTPVPVSQTVVLQYDFVTVFITAGIRREPPSSTGSVSIIVCSREGMEDPALLETIMVATEAKAEALQAMGLPLTGTPADVVITASEGAVAHRGAGRNSEVGKRVREGVLHGIPEALRRHDAPGEAVVTPAFFIFSRFKGGHWIEWTPDNCPYYPCHFVGQACDFCYCPFYPCSDEALGQWVESTNGGKIWNCARCRLLHEPEIADYYKRFPGASRDELMRLHEKGKKEKK
ncbi:MAG: cysteine-rich small domain-containing protein [Methanoregula sp.]|jgi:adenosylcobinamide hydrolase|uniref:cysteine-rich small domain-containing protein n=1 Tax=Methanoregula sp. TaxID=2052170 RepID=UPI003D0BF751